MILNTPARAQKIAFGIQGGMSILSLTNGGALLNRFTSPYSLNTEPEAGIFAELKYSNAFSLQPEIEYSSLGSKNGAFTNGIIAPGSAGALQNANNNRADLNYLLIPVLSKFGWNFNEAPLRFFVAGGPFAGLLMSAKQTVYDNTLNSGDVADVKPILHNFNAGIEGKMGLIFVTGKGNFFIEGGADLGLLKIQKATAINGNYSGAVSIAVGYSFWLGADFRTTNNPMQL